MTLKELINLKIVRDNVKILVFKKDSIGLNGIIKEFDITRIMGRLVEEADLLKNGVQPEMFNYKVKEIWGTKDKFKIGIVIEKEDE